MNLILVSLVVFGIWCTVSQNVDYETCSQPFECGPLREIPYPFYGGDRPVLCGSPGYEITCQGNIPRINTSQIIYRVLDITNQTQTLVVARDDLWDNVCALHLSNTSVDTALYDFYAAADDQQFTLLYGCTGGIQIPTMLFQFTCDDNGLVNGSAFLFATTGLPGLVAGVTCGPQVTVRMNRTAAAELAMSPTLPLLRMSLQTGFSIRWLADDQNCRSCLGSGGVCGSDGSGSFACHINSTQDGNNKFSSFAYAVDFHSIFPSHHKLHMFWAAI